MVSPKLLSKRLRRTLESRGIIVEAMYLYGSRARRQATPHSDIDVLVVSPTFAGKGFWARCALVGEAIGELTEPVQVYPVTPNEFHKPERGGFVESIRPDILLLYRRPKGR